MRSIVVHNYDSETDSLMVALTPGQKYQVIVNAPMVVQEGEDEEVDYLVEENTSSASRVQGERFIELVIRNRHTNLPVPNVVVQLRYPDGITEEFTTDEDGLVRVENVGYSDFSIVDIFAQ